MPTSCAEAESDVDDEIDTDPFLHIVAAALELPPPSTRAACSIFEVARRAATVTRKPARMLPQEDALPALRATIERSEAAGIVRNIGAVYPARWTAEDYERERARRAKQRPPRPSKRIRTKSTKLLSMIKLRGFDGFDD